MKMLILTVIKSKVCKFAIAIVSVSSKKNI